jgi:uncharacterized protein (TIGR00288 family)
MTEERLKFAVFIDFDNIEIGVRTTLSRRFDIDTVLEAIKERGEVVTKVAYGNWKRADEYSQAMTEHAVQMVQRNVTPRGDKNGADINLALDALEMAFTRAHINAFVIVGGDSDFIALVEKLKQYDKAVFIVGGRAFTSTILQRNCHEFIAYENLVAMSTPARKSPQRTQQTSSRSQIEDALPLVRRALKILADREVSPQLGLLKSTLLQLDSTFSEKDYGTGSFREFIQKMANAGFLALKQVDRSLMVELRDGEPQAAPPAPAPAPAAAPVVLQQEEPAVEVPESAPEPEPQNFEAPPRLQEPSRDLYATFQNARVKPRWPMYLRNMKQYLRAADPGFDERAHGFATIHDLVRQGQRDGILRIERNRQGILRIFPGDRFPGEGQSPLPLEPVDVEPQTMETALPEEFPKVPAEAPEFAQEPEAAVPEETPMPEPRSEVAPEPDPQPPAEEAAPPPEPEPKPKARRPRRAAPPKKKPTPRKKKSGSDHDK